MNDKIQKLYEDASLTDGPSGSRYSLPDELVEKFAELIVRECVTVINAAKPGVNQVPAEVALDMTAKNIKTYFGVDK